MKNTPEARAEVLRLLRKGNAYAPAAASAGISRMTLLRWRKEDPDFDEQCHAAEAQGIQKVEDAMLKKAITEEDPNSFQAAKFILERRKPTRDDYAPQNPNVPIGQFNLNVLAQVAPPLMQLGPSPKMIEGEVDHG